MKSKLFVAVFLVFVGSVQAAPVTWQLDDVVVEQFQPDSTYAYTSLTGSFVYDADTNVYSDVLIQSEPGPFFTNQIYTENAGRSWKPSAVESPSATGVIFNAGAAVSCPDFCDYSLTLNFGGALTNSGGVVSVLGNEALVGPTWGLFSSREIISGSVSAVPVPAAVWLFASALAGLGWLRRR